MTVKVIDMPKARRYEAQVNGEPGAAGFAEYIRTAELIAFVHTEVAPEHEGQGIGSALAQTSLDEARAAGLRVLATCPFYAGWIGRHPEYADLLYQARSKVID